MAALRGEMVTCATAAGFVNRPLTMASLIAPVPMKPIFSVCTPLSPCCVVKPDIARTAK